VSTASSLVVVVMSLIGVYLWCSYHFIMTTSLIGALVFNIVFWMEVWSYLSTSFMDPGTSQCPEWQAWAERQGGAEFLEVKGDRSSNDAQENSARLSGRRLVRAGQRTFCNKCHHLRPERAHHCKFKGTCVLRMDHFCWLTGNCIGWRNHKHFVLTLTYGVLTCLVFLTTAEMPPAHLGRATLQPHIIWIHSAQQGWTRLIDWYMPANDEILAVGWRDARESHCQETREDPRREKICPLPAWTSTGTVQGMPMDKDDDDKGEYTEEQQKEEAQREEEILQDIQHFKAEGAFLESKVSKVKLPEVPTKVCPWKRLLYLYGPTSYFDLPALAKSAKVTCCMLLLGNLYWLIVTLRIVTTNTTTVESLIKGRNPYRLPTLWQNWSQMMGSDFLWMLLPVLVVGRACDGTCFPMQQTSPMRQGSTTSKSTEH